jgi:hypothetical protein
MRRPKAGRPPNQELGKPVRSMGIKIRLTGEERERLLNHCNHVHMSVSELVRVMVVACIPKDDSVYQDNLVK